MIRLLSALVFFVKAPWTLLRAIFASNEKLSAEDAASTLYRFFRSKHVADLELIVFLAVLILICHLLLVVELPPPLSFDHLGHRLGTYVAPAIPIYAAVIAWAYLTAATRLGVVDLFACEIRTVCRVGTAFDIAKLYVERHDQCEKRIKEGKADSPLEEHPASSDGKGMVSEEDYFPVFANNSHDLEALEAIVVGHITEFYTYMKVVRDLQRRLALNESARLAKPTYLNAVYVIYLGYESARKAVKELIEFEPTRAENMMMILLTELVCYKFLCDQYQEDELRFERFTLRLTDYEKDLAYIEEKVEHRSTNDKDWGPAKRTLQVLRNRYKEMESTVRPLVSKKAALPQDNNPIKPLPGNVAA